MKMMTVKQVAKEVNVVPAIVYKWICRGEIEYYNIASYSASRASFRISESQLKDFLETKEGFQL